MYPLLTLEVVCSCFFGLAVDTINNPDSEFPRMIKKVGGGFDNWRIILLGQFFFHF